MAEMNDEQQKALMEKLRNMSPEELREFQKKQCIFCQIITKKMEGKTVYEDDKSIAILDINPASAGHILLLPKEHYSIMPQIPEDDIEHLGIVSKKLSLAILKGLKVQGTTIFVANGLAAGQRAQHFMVHIIPRTEGDNIGLTIPQRQIKDEELRKLHEAVQNKANEIFGISKEVVEKKAENVKKEDEKKDENDVEEKKVIKGISAESRISPARPKKERKRNKKETAKQKAKKEENGGASLDDIAGLFK